MVAAARLQLVIYCNYLTDILTFWSCFHVLSSDLNTECFVRRSIFRQYTKSSICRNSPLKTKNSPKAYAVYSENFTFESKRLKETSTVY